MVPHPEFRRSMTAQHVSETRGAAARSQTVRRHRIRNRFGLLLVAAGTRLATEAHATRAPRRAAA
jgi:hypothetical protein